MHQIKTFRTARLPLFFPGVMLFVFLLFFNTGGSFASQKTIVYKDFFIFKDRGWDVVCEAYEARENDVISEVLKKGKFSDLEYREGVGIFKRINLLPQESEILTPGLFYIPLKKIHENSFPRQHSGKIKLALKKLSLVKDLVQKHSIQYVLQLEDRIPDLIQARFGPQNTDYYNEGIKLFKLLNPSVDEFEFVFPEQTISLPDGNIRENDWYCDIYDDAGEFKKVIEPVYFPIFPPSYHKSIKGDGFSLLSQIGNALDARVYNRGTFYLRLSSGEEHEIDSSIYPVIALSQENFYILTSDDMIMGRPFSFYKQQSDSIHQIKVKERDHLETILDTIFRNETYNTSKNNIVISDDSVKITVQAKWIGSLKNSMGETGYLCITPVTSQRQQTPATVIRYLKAKKVRMQEILLNPKQHHSETVSTPVTHPLFRLGTLLSVDDQISLVRAFSEWMGTHYSSRKEISFDHDGIQVQMRSHMIRHPKGKDIVVDFGTLYEEAIWSLRESGFEVLKVQPNDSSYDIILKLLNVLKIHYIQNPSYLAAQRPSVFNTMIRLKGIEIKNSQDQAVLITPFKLHTELIHFFSDIGFQLIFMED